MLYALEKAGLLALLTTQAKSYKIFRDQLKYIWTIPI